jgi:hypothetical protein
MKFLFTLFCVLLILKISGAVSITFIWVLAPFWIPVLMVFSFMAIFIGGMFFLALLGEIK